MCLPPVSFRRIGRFARNRFSGKHEIDDRYLASARITASNAAPSGDCRLRLRCFELSAEFLQNAQRKAAP
jgi:hypothetical protein